MVVAANRSSSVSAGGGVRFMLDLGNDLDVCSGDDDSGESTGERRARLLGSRPGDLFRVRAAKISSTVPSGETQSRSVMSNSDMRSSGVSSWRVSSSI